MSDFDKKIAEYEGYANSEQKPDPKFLFKLECDISWLVEITIAENHRNKNPKETMKRAERFLQALDLMDRNSATKNYVRSAARKRCYNAWGRALLMQNQPSRAYNMFKKALRIEIADGNTGNFAPRMERVEKDANGCLDAIEQMKQSGYNDWNELLTEFQGVVKLFYPPNLAVVRIEKRIEQIAQEQSVGLIPKGKAFQQGAK